MSTIATQGTVPVVAASPAAQHPLLRATDRLRHVVEASAALVLAIDVAVVFCSVVWRYFLHEPLDWAEEVARALLMLLVFLGATIGLAKSQHMGIDSVRGLLAERPREFVVQCCNWIVMVN
jgi:TRAP-type C4-dicarboxylate transport system permease small subunit